ncbi:MAG: S8 family serine peptidase [Actinomycetota bacterium]
MRPPRRSTALAGTLAGVLALTALTATSAGAQGSPLGAVALDDDLAAALESATGELQVVVTFDGDGPPEPADVDLLRRTGVEAGITLSSLPIAGVLATPEEVRALAAAPGVRSVDLNRELTYDNADATALTGVDDVRRDPRLTKANGGLPVDGAGVGVLVNDSGIDGTHPDHQYGRDVVQNVLGATNLNGVDRQLLPVTWVENVPDTDRSGGHGTHVTGIVGGSGAASGGLYEGVAPGADLVGYGSGAALLLLDVLGGFDYALTHQREYGIRVVTNSWGDTSDRCTPVDPDDPVNVATKALADRNVVVVFSAGNSGPGECTITGNYKKAPWVIAVAAGDKERKLADFSSRGTPGGGGTVTVDGETLRWEDRPTLTAPGVNIVSTRAISPVGALGTPDDVEGIDPAHWPYYTTLSGTSMAAPHVAGVVALMLDVQPTLTPAKVKSILQQTATDMPGYAEWQVGAGYVDAYAAVTTASRSR